MGTEADRGSLLAPTGGVPVSPKLAAVVLLLGFGGCVLLCRPGNSPDSGACPLTKFMDADLADVTKHCEIDPASNQQCALDAANAGTPFRMQRDLLGIDSQIRVGFGLPKAGGPIYEYWYDGDPSGHWNDHPLVSRSSWRTLTLRPGCDPAEDLCLECADAFDHRVLCEVPLR